MTKSNRHCEVIFTHSGLTLQILESVLCFFNQAGQQFSVSLETLQAIRVTKGWRCLSLTMQVTFTFTFIYFLRHAHCTRHILQVITLIYVMFDLFNATSMGWNEKRLLLGKTSQKKLLFFGFCPNEGGRGRCPNFLAPIHKVHFWSIKGAFSLQNALNLNFKLFIGCIHDQKSRYSAFI